MEVSLDKTTPDVFEKFAAAVRRAPGGFGVPHGGGGFDYRSKPGWRTAAYRRFLSEILLALPGVKALPVMEEVKGDGLLPV